MGENDTKRVNVRVDPSTYGEWTAYVEENPPIQSLSHLIRKAVNTEITEDEGGSSSQDVGQLEFKIVAITELLEDIQDTTEGMDSRLNALEVEQEGRDRVEKHRPTLVSLPFGEPEPPFTDDLQANHIVPSGRLDDIAEYMGARPKFVSEALEYLFTNYGFVHKKEMQDGSPVYWRDKK